MLDYLYLNETQIEILYHNFIYELLINVLFLYPCTKYFIQG